LRLAFERDLLLAGTDIKILDLRFYQPRAWARGSSQPKADQPPRPRQAKRGGLAGANNSGGDQPPRPRQAKRGGAGWLGF